LTKLISGIAREDFFRWTMASRRKMLTWHS
jgi:hypothetical protein